MSAAKQPPAPPVKTGGGGGGGAGDGEDIPMVDVHMGEGDEPLLKRRIDLLRGELTASRLPADYEFSFAPSSMVGSWFHRLENDEIVWQGVILAEPAHATYLVQIETLAPGASDVQRLIPLDRMVNDEDGYDWRFYDTREDAMNAYYAWTASAKERA